MAFSQWKEFAPAFAHRVVQTEDLDMKSKRQDISQGKENELLGRGSVVYPVSIILALSRHGEQR